MKRVMNFGSLNIDYVYRVDHIVRPGETILSNHLSVFCGGKGLNQSIALARAGVDVFHGGCVGKTDGQLLTDELLATGVNIDNILSVDTRSGKAIIQVDSNGENSIVLFGGANQCITPSQIEETLLSFGKEDILLLQNEINNIGLIMSKASELGMTIVLNPAPYNEEINNLPLHLVDIFILNEIEGRDIINYEGNCTEQLMVALCKAFPSAEIVLTLGESGVKYFDGKKVFFKESFKVPVVDTTAAGDTFTGFFIAGLVDGWTSSKRIEVASMAAAIAVSKVGASASIPTMDEVRKECEWKRNK
jgi:ribokinase